MDRVLPKSRPIWRNPLVQGIVIGLAIVLGIPIVGSIAILSHWAQKDRSPIDDIGALLRRDLDLSLPSGTSIAQSHRIPAGMDAAGVWELNIPVDQVPRFIEQIKASAKAKGWSIADESSIGPFVPDAPAWWTPESAGVTRWVTLLNAGSDAYHIGYSPTSARCFVHWMTF